MAGLNMALLRADGIHRDIIRFVLLSGGCWLVDLGLLVTLTVAMGMQAGAANIISSLVAAAMVYTMSHSRIHDGVEHGQRARLLFYLCYTFGVIMLASFALAQLHAWLAAFIRVEAIVVLLAKIMITPPQLLCNFIVSRSVARAQFRKSCA